MYTRSEEGEAAAGARRGGRLLGGCRCREVCRAGQVRAHLAVAARLLRPLELLEVTLRGLRAGQTKLWVGGR